MMLAEGGGHGGGSMDWWFKNVDPFLNYPGFEFWRFLNLGIFVLIMVYLLKKPLSKAFKEKREVIRADLIKAENEKKAAEEKLKQAEMLLAGIDEEKTEITKKARAEGATERSRIEEEAEQNVKRLTELAANKIERKTAQLNVQLRRFSAEESIRLAEEKVRSVLNDAKDADLVKSNLKSIGGLRS